MASTGSSIHNLFNTQLPNIKKKPAPIPIRKAAHESTQSHGAVIPIKPAHTPLQN